MGNMLGFKVRIHANNQQKSILKYYADVARYAWNFALRLSYIDQENLQKGDKWSLTRISDYDKYFNQGKYALGEIKKTKTDPIYGSGVHVWCRGVPASVSQNPIKYHLKEAWQRCFKKLAGRPAFKGRNVCRSFTLSNIDFKSDKIVAERTHIDGGKLGRLRLGANVPVELIMRGKLMNTTFSEKAGAWFVAFCFEVPDEVYFKISDTRNRIVGVDIGMAEYVTCYDQVSGEVWHESFPKERLKKVEDRIERLQRRLAKCQHDSSRFRKLKQQIFARRVKQARIRINAAHVVSKRLTTESSLVVMEDLPLSNMTTSTAGPGKDRTVTCGLNREVLNMGLNHLRTQLTYKAERYGAHLALVDRLHISQKCGVCGEISPENSKSHTLFRCLACGHTEKTEVNAARNILTKYQKGVSS